MEEDAQRGEGGARAATPGCMKNIGERKRVNSEGGGWRNFGRVPWKGEGRGSIFLTRESYTDPQGGGLPYILVTGEGVSPKGGVRADPRREVLLPEGG